MQFQVPQFIDVEDKIIGPFTIKQFLYLAGGIGLGYLCLSLIPFIGWLFAIGAVILGSMLAFYRPNKKPFVDMIESAFYFYKNTRLYVWRRKEKVGDANIHIDLENFQSIQQVASQSTLPSNTNKLNDLSWSIDVPSSIEDKKVLGDSVGGGMRNSGDI